jgi:hypothetical protein
MIPIEPNSQSIILRATHILEIRLNTANPGEWSHHPSGWLERRVEIEVTLTDIFKGTLQEAENDTVRLTVIQLDSSSPWKTAAPGVWSEKSLEVGSHLVAFCIGQNSSAAELLKEPYCQQLQPAGDASDDVALALQAETEHLGLEQVIAQAIQTAPTLNGVFMEYLWARWESAALQNQPAFEWVMKLFELPGLSYVARASLLNLAIGDVLSGRASTPVTNHLAVSCSACSACRRPPCCTTTSSTRIYPACWAWEPATNAPLAMYLASIRPTTRRPKTHCKTIMATPIQPIYWIGYTMAEHKLLTPAYKLTFSQAASAGGGVGVPSLSGGKVVDTTSEAQASTVVELKVVLDLDTPTDSLTLIMGQVGSFRPQKGDQVKVELGYADDDRGLFHVITADLIDIESGLTRRRLVGHSSMQKLLTSFAGEHFEAKTAGEIIEDLAGRPGISVERTEPGSRFPAYVVDGPRSLYHHMRDLAGLCGFDLYITPEGKLVFEKFVGGQTVHIFEFGKHILDLDVYQREPTAPAVEARGESPGTGPTESWAWLTKDFASNKGTAGEGNPVFLLEHPALRNAQAARNAARALQTNLTRSALRGRLFLTGSPQVKLGDAIRLKSLPDESLNASFQVRAVTHRITKSAGFTTTIEFRSIA